MTELIIESDGSAIKKGNKLTLDFNITKQKFTEDNNEYILFNAKYLMFQDPQEQEFLIKQIAKTICSFCKGVKSVLIVGLGNRHISADSLGTECLRRVISTRNLIKSKISISAISTSVLGLTGIESADIIKSISDNLQPDLVILIDTLCAKSYETLAVNFQISNKGFTPGAGVGNFRKAIDKDFLNTKVITIGVPFVVYAKSFIEYAVNRLDDNSGADNIDFINNLLKVNFNNIILTIKDVDLAVKKCAYIISSAINMSLNNYSLFEQKSILGF